jgi:NADP-dependent 3-hydroxy acid dehydrogenase YdfG
MLRWVLAKHYFVPDVRNQTSVQDAILVTAHKAGKIDVLVASAGIVE